MRNREKPWFGCRKGGWPEYSPDIHPPTHYRVLEVDEPVPELTEEQIREALAKGAESANELGKMLKASFGLSAAQRTLILD